MRIASAPNMSISSSGETPPRDFDMRLPSSRTQPWWKSRWNGSRTPSIPKSFSALQKKRE